MSRFLGLGTVLLGFYCYLDIRKPTFLFMNDTDILVTAEELGRYLRVNTSRVHQLSREGHIPKPSAPKPRKGVARWNLMECIHSYWDYKESVNTKPEAKDSSYWVEKTRLTQAQANREELLVAEKKGELTNTEEIYNQFSGLVLACRAKLLSLPTKMAYELLEIDNPNIIKNKLELTIDEALKELAVIELGNEQDTDSENH